MCATHRSKVTHYLYKFIDYLLEQIREAIWESAELAQTEYIKINIVSKSTFLYEYDAPCFFFKSVVMVFYNNSFGITFCQSQAIMTYCIDKSN